MKFILSLISLLIAIYSLSQGSVSVPITGCEPTGISTNPENYSNPNDPSGDRQWDWRMEEFTVYLSNTSGTAGTPVTIRSPFFDQNGNANTYSLANSIEKDFRSEDGWELLYRKFGSTAQGVSTPYFMLYNRFTGTVRVFVNIINAGSFPFTAAGLHLTMTPAFNTNFPTVRQTAILNQLGEYTFANDNLQKDAAHFAPNTYENTGVNNNYYWLYADFNVLFDACTCGLVGDWYFQAGLINNLEVQLQLNGTLTTIVDANPSGANPNETSVNGFFGEIHDYAAFGSGVINGITGILNSANKGYDDGVALQTAGQNFANNSGKIIGKKKAVNLALILGKLFFEVPKVNMFLNLASTLVTTVTKLGDDYDALTNDSPKGLEAIKQPTITESQLKVNVTGQITVSSPYVNNALRVPGSKIAQGQGDILFTNPIYDEILGVWNLFEQPKFEIVEYSVNNPATLYVGQIDLGPSLGIQDASNLTMPVFPNIQQLTLKELPKIVLNEASGLQIIDVDYQIEFNNLENSITYQLQGPMMPGPFSYFEDMKDTFLLNYRNAFYSTSFDDREAYLESVGLELQIRDASGWDTARIASPFLGQNCIKNYPIFSYSKIINPRLRVKVILEPINPDPNSNIDQIIMIHTFPGVKTNRFSSDNYTVSGTLYWNEAHPSFQQIEVTLPIDLSPYLSGYSTNSILEDETISDGFTVLGDIYVWEDVSFSSGNHIIQATGNIYINKPLTNLPSNSKVTFQAAKHIIVSPESFVDPEIVLEIVPSLALSCMEEVDTYPTPKEIANFCNGSIYNDRSNPSPKENTNLVTPEIEYLPIFKQTEFFFSVFPNPASNSGIIKLSTSFGNERVEIYDISGRKAMFKYVLNGDTIELDLTTIQAGMYQVILFSNTGTFSQPLIIVK